MTAPSLLDELEGVVRLSEAATPGEWVCYPGGKRATVHSPRGHVAFFSQRSFGARGEGPVTADEMVSNARLTAASVNFFRTHHAEIANMAKRLEAAERDARRYRYLRRPQAWKENYLRRLGGISAIFVSDGHCGHAMDTEALDAAIDATQEGEG